MQKTAMQYGRLSDADKNTIIRAALIWSGQDGKKTQLLNQIVLPACEAICRAKSRKGARQVVEAVQEAVRWPDGVRLVKLRKAVK